MRLKVILIIIAVLIAGLAYVYYKPSSRQSREKGEACVNSGGQVASTLCCRENIVDFPNLCFIGACGCAPEFSKTVKTCDCGGDKCFDGNGCVSRVDYFKTHRKK